jgi:seryl-tRNA synthetase
MLEQLKRFDADRADMEEMLELSAYGRTLVAEYDALSVPQPEWLAEVLDRLKKAIADKRRDAILKALKTVKARKETLKSAEEKRKDAEAEIERLTKMLDG